MAASLETRISKSFSLANNFKIILWATLACLLTSCAGTTAFTNSPQQKNQWWRVQFKFVWSEDTAAEFHFHPLIADLVIRPIVREFKENMSLWRFHRRAARDSAGHQFSFIFYTDKRTAKLVREKIDSSDVAQSLLDENVVQSVKTSPFRSENGRTIGATSDPSWPTEIQQSWPYFIMGTSQSWLDLIAQIRINSVDIESLSTDELLDFYQTLETELTENWTSYGRHAYLHHINAIFGYQPVFLFETETLQNF